MIGEPFCLPLHAVRDAPYTNVLGELAASPKDTETLAFLQLGNCCALIRVITNQS